MKIWALDVDINHTVLPQNSCKSLCLTCSDQFFVEEVEVSLCRHCTVMHQHSLARLSAPAPLMRLFHEGDETAWLDTVRCASDCVTRVNR